MANRTTLFRMLLVAATVGIASLAQTTRAHALDCGDRLIAPGDPMGYVRAFCGEPSSIVTNGSFAGSTRLGYVALPVEIWVYDFGPDRLMVEIAFQRGRVLYEQVLTRGTDAGHVPDGPANARSYYTHRDSRALHRPAELAAPAVPVRTPPAR